MIARISLSVRIRGSARPLSMADQRPLDWRRRLEEMAALFLRFLPRFRQRIGSAYGIVESPGGISPPGAPRTVHDALESHGSRCSTVA